MKWQAKYPNAINLPQSWQQLPRGERYCTAISDYFGKWLPKILGYQILKIGGLSGEIQCNLPLRHQMIIAPEISKKITALYADQADYSLIQANPTELPLVEKSIDACFLANTINFSQDPHQLLREVERVTMADGYLFISLFNPAGTLLFKRYLNKSPDKFLFRRFCAWRVVDWLELLNFEVLDMQYIEIKKSVHFARHFAPLITIVARKRTFPLCLTPQKVRFNPKEILNPVEAFQEKCK
ncbi:methyltransferase family protein [Cricetibacter osteomyelitidis]|uniref:Methyltransferase family protein n=1 Tax=Cricetibacter osteomyelitidis TaxID=1521931 RepID=A0A4R2T125_9PAST|nr:class I SAM-dependent methyltransferase [Cricetibacter osteomyelitidis]TCP94786.1 methyltransferase family protein [Cricetibacter osteomyelitidis]